VVELVLNADHLERVLLPALRDCRHRLFIATADVKDVHLPRAGGRAESFLKMVDALGKRGVDVRLLHSGTPSGPVMESLRTIAPAGLTMRRCPRVHAKAIIVDGVRMYLGSANMTGAGIGAKSPRRRNFEAGVWTDALHLIDPVIDMLDGIWEGRQCADCGRKDHCPVPLEEPEF
jgi:phosphatidylserine/phosphatidylglycerophosphate/cardiolipin synthase-like enzyme